MFSFYQSEKYDFQEIKHDLKKIDFSDGTCLIDLTLHNTILDDELTIKWDVVNANQEIIELVHIVEVLKSKYKIGMKNISLRVPYLPYARADRRFHKNQSYGLKIFAGFMQDFNQIFTEDVHSEKSGAWLDNLHEIPTLEQARFPRKAFKGVPYNKTTLRYLIDYDDFMVCAPDQGAWNRCKDFAEEINYAEYGFEFFDESYHKIPLNQKNISISFCEKKRCTETGAITETQLDENVNYKDKTILIVDDICDDGATFVQLAYKLKEQGAESVSLFATHMIASKGLQALEIFENVYYINKVGNYF
jgi:ribose-phosphate pyrophosphokinase